MADLTHTHKVNVCGENFQIKSDVPSHIIEKIAGYVDYKVKEVGSHSVNNGDKLRLCVLAAMNIAGELFELKNKLEEQEKISAFIENKAKSLGESLDRASTKI